jgi:hypothetical protein
LPGHGTVEYEETELAFYTVAWHEDNKHITEVSNPRVIEISYRSPQLTLWTLGPDEWLLFKKLPDYAPRTKRKRIDVIQLSLPALDEDQCQGQYPLDPLRQLEFDPPQVILSDVVMLEHK